MAENNKVKGTVKWFDLRKGYGYVTAEDGKEYFTHVTAVEKGRTYTGFEDGDEVEFAIDTTSDKRGPIATGVVLTKEEKPPRKPKKPKTEKSAE